MSNENLNSSYGEIEEIIVEVSVILLTKQVLSEEKINTLFTRLDELSKSFGGEDVLPKRVTSLLFDFYVRVESELEYIQKKDEVLRYFKGDLIDHLKKIF